MKFSLLIEHTSNVMLRVVSTLDIVLDRHCLVLLVNNVQNM